MPWNLQSIVPKNYPRLCVEELRMCIKVIEKHGLAMIFCWRVWKRNGEKVSGWCEPTPHLVGQTLRWFRIGKISSCFLLFAHLSTTQAWIFRNKKNISSPPVTWRIIPRSKYLGSPQFTSHLDHLEGEQPYFTGLPMTMVINHLQVLGMILQSTTLKNNGSSTWIIEAPHVCWII